MNRVTRFLLVISTFFLISCENNMVDDTSNKEISFDSLITLNILGLNLNNQGLLDSSFNIFTKIINIDSSFYLAYNNRAMIYTKWKQYDKAFADISYALNNDTIKHSNYYLNRMNIYIYTKRYAEALDDINIALEIEDTAEYYKPALSTIYGKRAECNMQLGNYQESIEDAKLAIHYNPNYYLAYYRRAIAYFELGEKEKACKDLLKAKELGLENIPEELMNKCK